MQQSNRTVTDGMQQESELLRPEQAAVRCNVSKFTLRHWRLNGAGPRFIRLSRRAVRYRLSDIEEWLKEREQAA